MLLRVQLFEWHDLDWMPTLLKDCHRELLYFLYENTDLAKRLAPCFEDVLQASGARRILDFCSGSGGIMPLVRQHFARSGGTANIAPLTLTDLYPNVTAYKRIIAERGPGTGGIDFVASPVDATDCDLGAGGDSLRTIVSAFHHMPSSLAVRILQNAVATGSPIAVVEGTQRCLWDLLTIPVFVPAIQLLVTPLIKPFRPSRLLFTYILPVLPLMCIWDCAISVLRTYRPNELREMARQADPDCSFRWSCGECRLGLVGLTWCIGFPAARPALRDVFAQGNF